MTSARSLSALLVTLTAIVTGGCARAANEQGPPRAAAAHAVIDRPSGQIVKPFDRVGLTEREVWSLDYAREILLSKCMKDRGLAYDIVDYRQQTPRPDRTYGVWRIEDARASGYGQPKDDAVRSAMLAANGGQGPQWESALRTCAATKELTELSMSPQQTAAAVVDTYMAAFDTPEGRSAHEDWVKCLTRAGVSPPSDTQWIAPAWAEAPLEDQIRIAVIDVRCKDTNKTVQRFADVEASFQQAIIDADAATYAAQQSKASRLKLEVARVIAQHGG